MATDLVVDDSILSTEKIEHGIARDAILLQVEFNKIQMRLDSYKQRLRDLANGNSKEIVVEGVGKINISVPFAGKTTPVLIFDEEKLNKVPELRAKLINHGVAKESIKTVPASQAKVTIKPNV